MDIKSLETFCLLASNKSFTKTADKLFVTQPAVSKQIAQLEEEFNVSLINRTTKKMNLTRAGEIFYEYSLKILREVNTLKLVMHNFSGLNSGEISIGASTLPGEYILPKLILNFRKKYPDINFNLVIKDSFRIINDISSGLIELGIVGSKQNKKELLYSYFIEDEIVFAGKDSKTKAIDNIHQLKNFPFINRETGSGTIHTVKNFLMEKGFDYNDLNFIIKVGSLTAVKQLLIKGLGYAFISLKAIESELKRGEISTIDIKGITPIKRNFYIVTSNHFSLSPAAEMLKKILLNLDLNK